MSDFISRQAAIDAISNNLLIDTKCYTDGYKDGRDDAIKTVAGLQGADVRPNVRGEWEMILHPGLYPSNVLCSRCFNIGSYAGFNFCPDCGADMRERTGE